MILELFPKKKEEDISRFLIRHKANCKFEFVDFDGPNLSEFELQNFINQCLERTLLYLKLNYIDVECYDAMYFTIDDEDFRCCQLTEDLSKLSIKFNLCFDSLIDMNKEEKDAYFYEGDCWMAENKMEYTNSFIADVYRPNIWDNSEDIESIFNSLDTVPIYKIDNFEFFSVLEIKEGYNYFDAFR